METNSPNWVQYVTMVLAIVLIGGLFIGVNSITDAIPETPVVPTAAEIAALVVIPDTVDMNKINKIYDKLDANRFDEGDIDRDIINAAENYIAQEMDIDDFEELLADLIGIDEDYLEINYLESTITVDRQITAENRDEAEDGNIKLEGFLRIKYIDTDDEDETEVIYVVITADVTDAEDKDNDQDVEFSIREVSRNFEFD